jgi:glycerophosphoryl diester phosphodiesterase
MSERPLVIAHRGACKYAPENTLAAIRKAIELKVDGVEIDIHLTKDKVPVLLHYSDLTEFTTSYGFVQKTTLRALKTIDIGSSISPAFRNERIPTLEEALTLLATTSLIINIEIKPQPYWHFGIEERVVRLVRALGVANRTIFSTFSPLVLMRLRYVASDIPRALLISSGGFPFLRSRFFGKFGKIANLHSFKGAITPELVQGTRARGWKIWAWTVNTRSELKRMLHVGVDGIITDDPMLAHEVIQEGPHGI